MPQFLKVALRFFALSAIVVGAVAIYLWRRARLRRPTASRREKLMPYLRQVMRNFT